MKNLSVLGTFFLFTSLANAAPVTCTTNIHHDPRLGAAEITVTSAGGKQALVTLVIHGGIAHRVSATRKFFVEMKSHGPEVVEYFNEKEDFSLEICFQPIGGQIHGTFTDESQGQRVSSPVVCVAAMNSPLLGEVDRAR